MSIQIFREGGIRSFGKRKAIKWLKLVIAQEGYVLENLNFILVSDEDLLAMNRKYLEHDYYTDVITFDYAEVAATINGEVYISLDRIKENAKSLELSWQSELSRVMVHGLLHLMGYDDKTPELKRTMKSREDFYLNLQLSN